MSRARACVLLVVLLASSGCNVNKMAVDQMVPLLEQTRDDFLRGGVVDNARAAGPGLIALLNGLALASPENPELRALQAELNFSYAFAFLEQSDPAWATAFYQKAQAAALAGLAGENEDLASELSRLPLSELEAALADADEEDELPCLFWWAMARGAEVNLHRSDPERVTDLPRVDVVMEWVASKRPGYFNAGPHLYLGMRYLSLPESLGGEPEKGLGHLEQVLAKTRGKHLLAKVIKAQFYAPSLAATPAGAPIEDVLAAQKRAWEAFFSGLSEVLAAPDDLWPEAALFNAVAKQRARELLSDPSANNIIPPEGVENPYSKSAAASDEGWGGDDDDDDDGSWGD